MKLYTVSSQHSARHVFGTQEMFPPPTLPPAQDRNYTEKYSISMVPNIMSYYPQSPTVILQ